MRNKIAKRKRKWLLQHGVEIIEEKLVKERCCRRKDWCYVTVAKYKGYTISAPEYDRLASYQAIIECIPYCDENPRLEKENENEF